MMKILHEKFLLKLKITLIVINVGYRSYYKLTTEDAKEERQYMVRSIKIKNYVDLKPLLLF